MSRDNTTDMLLAALRELLDNEPEPVDLDVHEGYHRISVARRYDEWERSVSAYRLLLGVRLVNEALDAADAPSYFSVEDESGWRYLVPREYVPRGTPELLAAAYLAIDSDGNVRKNRWGAVTP